MDNVRHSPLATEITSTRVSASETDTAIGQEHVGHALLIGLAAIQREQLHTGEIPSYQRFAAGSFAYRRSPLISAFVYEALAYFDARTPQRATGALAMLPIQYRHWFTRVAIEIRRRIRAYILDQEEPSGMWRFFGRYSGIDPDVETTTCAATVLLETSERRPSASQRDHVAAVLRFRSAEGPFFTFMAPGGRGYGWIGETGQPIAGFDRVVNADVLRYLAYAGLGNAPEAAPLIAYLSEEIARGDAPRGSPLFPNPLSFFCAVARAWREAEAPGLDALASSLIPHILNRQDAAGAFGGALSTALATIALLDLNHRGPALELARGAIIHGAHASGGWGWEGVLRSDFGSPAYTTALSMLALVRSSLVT